jgi:hypothetical protein
MSSAPSRRFNVWYGLLLTAIVVGAVVLDRAIDAGNRVIVAALVFTGLAYVVAAGLVAIVRLVRHR